MSFMKARNNKGPRTVPCGTPEHTGSLPGLLQLFVRDLSFHFIIILPNINKLMILADGERMHHLQLPLLVYSVRIPHCARVF